MRAVVQRVSEAGVTVDGNIVGSIKEGLVVLLGIGLQDNHKDIEYLAEKIVNLRIFADQNGKMNLSLLDVGGSLLVVSQFTLYGDCRKGRRPGYDKAARPEDAKLLYNEFLDCCRSYGIVVEAGIFQADMTVHIKNEGPVTLLLDSKKEF
jgi:D-tyrosyl-tRNA(Tyr) deacylase